MPKPITSRPPEPLATGTLANKPLAHLLVYALERRLTGTFELSDEPSERVLVSVRNGLVARVSSRAPVIFLGHVLFESGVIDGAQLSASLAEVASSNRLHGQVLLERCLVRRDQLAEALRQQRARKLHHAFGLGPCATFAFYPRVDLVGQRPDDVEPTDPLPLVWRGVSLCPSWEHVRSAILTVGPRRIRVTGELERIGLRAGERVAAELLRQVPSTIDQFTARAGLETRAAELLAYFLVITKLVEMVDPVLPAQSRPTPPAGLGAVLDSGEYLRNISFTMRAAARDGDPLRIPSPMAGQIKATRARTQPAPPNDAPSPASDREADGLLAQAEMHLVLGEREVAIGFVRQALAMSPEMPEALALLAYLEAMGLPEGEETYLRDLIRMLDAALGKDDACRHGHFYRAELKRRLGDHEGAVRDLRQAVMQDPDDPAPKRELRAYEQKVRDGSIVLRATSGGASRPPSFLDRLRGK